MRFPPFVDAPIHRLAGAGEGGARFSRASARSAIARKAVGIAPSTKVALGARARNTAQPPGGPSVASLCAHLSVRVRNIRQIVRLSVGP